MASGALAAGLPAVEIDGEYYWDGGVVSNTPLSRVLTAEPRRDDARPSRWISGRRTAGCPPTCREVWSRQKDIQYSSRTRADHQRT